MESACVRKARVRVGWIRNVTGHTAPSATKGIHYTTAIGRCPLPPHTLHPLTHGHEGELKTTLDSLSEYLIREVGKADIGGP